jgi:hypothetical protein
MGPNDNIIASWESYDADWNHGVLRIAHSNDAGGQWSNVSEFGEGESDTGNGQLRYVSENTWALIYEDYTEGSIKSSFSVDGGLTWSEHVILSDAEGAWSLDAVSALQNGTLVVLLDDGHQLYARYGNPVTENWSEFTIISDSTSQIFGYVSIVSSGANTWTASFMTGNGVQSAVLTSLNVPLEPVVPEVPQTPEASGEPTLEEPTIAITSNGVVTQFVGSPALASSLSQSPVTDDVSIPDEVENPAAQNTSHSESSSQNNGVLIFVVLGLVALGGVGAGLTWIVRLLAR